MPTNITIKNTNQRNQIKITPETSEVNPKTNKLHWTAKVDAYLKPGEVTSVWVAENQRITIQEMPT